MGLNDHRKQWNFVVKASPEACVGAFARAMDGKSVFSARKAKWEVSRQGKGAVATYKGRGGLVAAASVLSGRVADVEATAVGSRLQMEVTRYDASGGVTECSLWLASRGTQHGLTVDAGFFRSYMNEVESALRALDPGLRATKS